MSRRWIAASLLLVVPLLPGPSLASGNGNGAHPPRFGSAEEYPYDNGAALVYQQAGSELDPLSASIADEVRVTHTIAPQSFDILYNSPSVYVASGSDDYFTGRCGDQQVRVRFPQGVASGLGPDSPAIVLNPRGANQDFSGHPVELRMWQARIHRKAKTFSASGCGMFHYSNRSTSSTGNDGTPFVGNGTGSGLSYLYGMVRPGEVQAGLIPHAIRVAYSSCDFRDAREADAYRAPATGTDQRKGSGACTPPDRRMAMGMRVRLDASVDCDSRTVPDNPRIRESHALMVGFVQTLCHALQDYGFMPLDGTGDSHFVIYAEGSRSAHWSGVLGKRDPSSGYAWAIRDAATAPDGIIRSATDGIPWDHWEVMAEGS